MSCTHETAPILRAAGLRSTIARNAVVAALRHASGHRSVDDIIRRIEGDMAMPGAVAASTVYRTLETLEGIGLVGSVRLPGAAVTFEWVGGAADAHSHLVCDRCGGEQLLPADVMESLVRDIEQRTSFRPAPGHLAIRGECERCRPD